MPNIGGLASWPTEAILYQATIRKARYPSKSTILFPDTLILSLHRFRFAALRPYGNPNISDHWDIMQMPVRHIGVLPLNGMNSTLH